MKILDAWRGLVFEQFTTPATRFLSNPDPFGNPMGYRVKVATAAILDALVRAQPPEIIAAAMEPLMRVQAVQGRPASEAVAFVPLLERAVRQVDEAMTPEHAAGLKQRLDAVLLIAFDEYVRCREEIFDIRVREARRRVSTLLDRMAVADEQAGC